VGAGPDRLAHDWRDAASRRQRRLGRIAATWRS
jgi:hypothetical protein